MAVVVAVRDAALGVGVGVVPVRGLARVPGLRLVATVVVAVLAPPEPRL